MPVRTADARWQGDLNDGDGTVSVGSGAIRDQAYSYASRFEEGAGTNPDELLGAAHASCFTMFLSSLLSGDGHTVEDLRTEARVHLSTEGGPHLSHVELVTEGRVPGIDQETFRDYAERAKAGCPISKALASLEVQLSATLDGG